LYLQSLDAMSFLLCLAGLVLLFAGRGGLLWVWPAFLLLALALPMPHQVRVGLAHPLQRLATVVSTYVLQTIGFPAVAEGNVILLREARIGVVEACGGLSMLIVFFALATAVAILARRPLLDRLLLVASAIPIAVIANVARIVVTSIVHDQVGADAGALCHDLAGWLMMPLALALLALELKLLDRVLLEHRRA